MSFDNSTLTAESRDTSTLRAVSRGNKVFEVKACGFVSLYLGGFIKAKLGVNCHAFIRKLNGKLPELSGGKKTIVKIESPQDWCDHYGVEVNDGIAIVFKALNEDFSSGRDSSFKYLPGTAPKADKFDDIECSHGLHFSPHPRMALAFHVNAKKFVACPVKVESMLLFMNGAYPEKCKAPELAAPCWEVTEDGERV